MSVIEEWRLSGLALEELIRLAHREGGIAAELAKRFEQDDHVNRSIGRIKELASLCQAHGISMNYFPEDLAVLDELEKMTHETLGIEEDPIEPACTVVQTTEHTELWRMSS